MKITFTVKTEVAPGSYRNRGFAHVGSEGEVCAFLKAALMGLSDGQSVVGIEIDGKGE